MNQKFKRTLGCTYSYCDNFETVPENAKKAFLKHSFQLMPTERFICSCWIDQILTPIDSFVIVTSERVYCKKPTGIGQNFFESVSGVEINLFKNLEVLSTGNKTTLFFQINIPSERLIELLFGKINAALMEFRSKGHPDSNDIVKSLQKLKELQEKGLITESEFHEKRAKIMASI